MTQLNFCLGIHCHQPVGNFDSVFSDAVNKAYLPFLETLDEFPSIKISLHYSGVLLQWIEQHRPEFLSLIERMIKRGQIELMTGGFYEPLLPIIPDCDKVGQIKKLTRYLTERFGCHPTGLWLAERVWEPHLPASLRDAGVTYTVVDDTHFKIAGVTEPDIFGYFLTDELGQAIAIFPISTTLRYTIPFQAPEVTIDYFCSIATEAGDRLIVMADDGEKFGIWPETNRHCYTDGWLRRFFETLEANRDWLRLLTFSEALQQCQPRGQVYLPTASYFEMMEWAMPAHTILRYEDFVNKLKEYDLYDRYKMFVRGGLWRNFFVKYPESNNIHKKMLRVSARVQQAAESAPDHPAVHEAQDNLWQGQCNCAYWHGVFGGLYLTHLRSALYNRLIRAETTLDALLHKNQNWIDVTTCDLDCDGQEELLVETPLENLYFKPAQGATLFEHDFKPAAINLIDTLRRREEAYHQRIRDPAPALPPNPESTKSIHDLLRPKEANLEKLLHYDWYPRVSLIDHFLNPATTLDGFSACQYAEDGDCVNQPYQTRVEKGRNRCVLEFSRDGHLYQGQAIVPFHTVKTLTIRPTRSGFDADYTIQNNAPLPMRTLFGIEFNVNLLAGNAPDRFYFVTGQSLVHPALNSRGTSARATDFGLVDEWLKIRVHFAVSTAATLWRFPIETVSQSEGGFERVYQSSVLLPHWSLDLAPDQKWSVSMSYRIETLAQ